MDNNIKNDSIESKNETKPTNVSQKVNNGNNQNQAPNISKYSGKQLLHNLQNRPIP